MARTAGYPTHCRWSLRKVTDGSHFMRLFERMIDDESGFLHNMDSIVEEYRKGCMYGLEMHDEDACRLKEQYQPHRNPHPILLEGTDYAPCFCITTPDRQKIIMIWTYSRVRRHGLATKLIRFLGATEVWNIINDSQPFWDTLPDLKVADSAS